MGVRERMLTLRLLEKLRDKSDYAHDLGLEICDAPHWAKDSSEETETP